MPIIRTHRASIYACVLPTQARLLIILCRTISDYNRASPLVLVHFDTTISGKVWTITDIFPILIYIRSIGKRVSFKIHISKKIYIFNLFTK
ncbi:hypothetical protein PanWU01x14_223320 [Parasponia andersonii]|uniref:Uncharacterized protein n=1 Tax=Parasponia andersonii TaxID=3476 RepID=A0A2P5BNS9_PARAD|nr:hypothetical protein PanWU01x14_223320 [Parasponia andersonii]